MDCGVQKRQKIRCISKCFPRPAVATGEQSTASKFCPAGDKRKKRRIKPIENMLTKIECVVSFSFAVLFACAGCTSMMEFDRHSLPSFSTKEMFEVYVLHSIPIEVLTLSRRSFLLPTTAIAFRSEYSMQPIILQYLASNTSASIWPQMTEHSAEWDTRMIIYASLGTTEVSEWVSSSLLGRISGVTFNHYLDWLEDFQAVEHQFTFHTYASYATMFQASYTWNAFIEKSMDVLASLSVSMRPLLPVSYSDTIVRIHDNVTVVRDYDAVLSYYSAVINCLNDILTDDYGVALGYCITRNNLQYVYFCDVATCYRATAYQVVQATQDFVIPSRKTPPLETINVLDYMIALLIVILMLTGCGCAMLKLEIIQNNELYRKVCSTLNRMGLDCLLDNSGHDRAIESCELVSRNSNGLEDA